MLDCARERWWVSPEQAHFAVVDIRLNVRVNLGVIDGVSDRGASRRVLEVVDEAAKIVEQQPGVLDVLIEQCVGLGGHGYAANVPSTKTVRSSWSWQSRATSVTCSEIPSAVVS